jgi:hypothetical protein
MSRAQLKNFRAPRNAGKNLTPCAQSAQTGLQFLIITISKHRTHCKVSSCRVVKVFLESCGCYRYSDDFLFLAKPLVPGGSISFTPGPVGFLSKNEELLGP